MKFKEIRVAGDEIDFEGTVDEAIDILLKAKEAGWTHIDVTYYGGEYREYILCKYRPETEQEYSFRMEVAENQKEIRRREYEKLKKEFGE